MGNRSTVLKSCLTRVRPLKSLPVRSCPRVTCFPYGPPPCGHTRARARPVNTPAHKFLREFEPGDGGERPTMNARDGSATRSEAATRAAAPALARWKCTEERAGAAGGAAPARAGGDGASLRAPRMSMAAELLVSLPLRGCVFTRLICLVALLGRSANRSSPRWLFLTANGTHAHYYCFFQFSAGQNPLTLV